MDLPKTRNPEKWTKDVAISKKDFMTNNIGGMDMMEYFKKRGLKPKFSFENGVATNLETGEKIQL